MLCSIPDIAPIIQKTHSEPVLVSNQKTSNLKPIPTIVSNGTFNHPEHIHSITTTNTRSTTLLRNESKDSYLFSSNRGYLSPNSDSSDSLFAFNNHNASNPNLIETQSLNRQNSTNNIIIPSDNSSDFYLDSSNDSSRANLASLNISNKRSLSPTFQTDSTLTKNKKPKDTNVGQFIINFKNLEKIDLF